jgi:hypothetical protein
MRLSYLSPKAKICQSIVAGSASPKAMAKAVAAGKCQAAKPRISATR